MCYPDQKVFIFGINDHVLEFNYEQMNFTKKYKAEFSVCHIEGVSNDTFLTGEYGGHLELI